MKQIMIDLIRKHWYFEVGALESMSENEVREIYEDTVYPGLDGYGNISLNSKLEVPVLHGGFSYYPEKNINNKSNSIRIPEIQVYFI